METARTQKLKSVNIKGKEYTEVHERILFIAQNFDHEITTDYQFFPTEKMWVVKATLKIHDDKGERVYTGLAQEIVGDGYINKTSALENCETSAVGRACAMAGIGINDGVASVDEINKAKAREQYNEQPKTKQPTKELKTDSQEWKNLVKSVENGASFTLNQIKKKYKVSQEVEQSLNELNIF